MKRGFLLRAQEKKNAASKGTGKVAKKGSSTDDNVVVVAAKDHGDNNHKPELPVHPSLAPHLIFDPKGGPPRMPLSYGKVDDDAKAIPEDYYEKNRYWSKELDAFQTDMPFVPGMTITTTVPQPEDGEGLSEWIVKGGATKAKVLNAPGYPSGMVQPRRPDMYAIKETPDMGFGVFATCDIKCGELIFSERPLLVAPRGFDIAPNVPAHYTAEQICQVSMMNFERMLQAAVERMDPPNREAYMALMNNHKEDGSGPLLGIMRTNGYGLSNLYDGNDPDDDMLLYSAIGKIGSRINHSCQPNIHQGFELASFSLQFRAYRDLKAGEQLFYAYCDISQGVADRQAKLAPYGVVCKCPSCVNATPASDKFRKDVVGEVNRYAKLAIEKFLHEAEFDIKTLGPLLKLEKAMIEEGVDANQSFVYLLNTILTLYMKLGMFGKAQGYADRLDSYDSLKNADSVGKKAIH